MNGFTLLELLAVIVILAIILLIAVPMMSNIIDSVKLKVFDASTRLIIRAAEQDYLDRNIKNDRREVVHKFNNYNQTTLPADVDNLDFSGKGPKEGIIIVYSDGSIEIRVSDGEYYTQTDGSGNLKDITAYDPTIHDPLLEGTTDWIFEVTIPSGGDTFSFGSVDTNLTINWGDGDEETFTYVGADYITHDYEEGVYNVTVSGTSNHISFCNVVDFENDWDCPDGTPWYLTDILTPIPVSMGLTNAYAMFAYLDVDRFSSLNFFDAASANITNMMDMFAEAINFNQNITNWNTSNVTTLYGMFSNSFSFNQPIGTWDVSSVTNMGYVFAYATSFNQPLNNWDISNVIAMGGIFYGAEVFNQPLNSWDTSSVTDMRWVFSEAYDFNQPIGNWDTSSVTTMYKMFEKAYSFNQPLSTFNTINVTNMNSMFYQAEAFNQPLDNWDTAKVTDMRYMFYRTFAFNQPLNSWDTGKVTNMSGMFRNTPLFNQPLDNWDTSSVTTTFEMFKDTPIFNQPIGNWDTSKMTTMENMFQCSKDFNQDISAWNTSSATNMIGMFDCAETFNQNLSTWCVSNIPAKPLNFDRYAVAWALPKPIWGTCP